MIAFFVTLAVFSWAWWWLLILRPLKRAHYQPALLPLIPATAAQISAFAILTSVALQPDNFYSAVILPPAVFIAPFTISKSYFGNFIAPFSGSVLFATISFVASLCLMWVLIRPYRKFILLPALIISTVVLVYSAEQTSRSEMKAALQNLGGECFVRSPIWASSKFAGREFQWDLHAITVKDGQWYGWSYRTLDFYRLTAGNGNGKMRLCLQQSSSR